MNSQETFAQTKARLLQAAEDRTADLPGNAAFLEDGSVACFPREDGDSRYPYGHDGFTLWVYASGALHANDGRFNVLQRMFEGQDQGSAFWLGLPRPDGSYRPVPLTSVPFQGSWAERTEERFTVFQPTAAWFFTRVGGLLAVERIHVDAQNRIVFTVEVENLATQPQPVYLASFQNPFVCHELFESSEYRWFREVRYLAEQGGPLGSFEVRVNEDLSRTESILNVGALHRGLALDGAVLVGHEATSSRRDFTGSQHTGLAHARALEEGHFARCKPVTAFTEIGIAGDLLHVELAPGGRVRLDTVLELHRGLRAESYRFVPLDVSAEGLDQAGSESAAREADSHGGLSLEVGNRVFGTFFHHLKRQVKLTALHRGYIDLTDFSFIGIRDIFQGIEALVWWQPEACRRKMLEALSYTFTDGRCPRQYSVPPVPGPHSAMDLRLFVDQGNWVLTAVSAYLKVTGDRSFLDEPVGYHVIVEEKAKLVAPATEVDTVLGHLERILGFLLSHVDEETGGLHALYGDWNDALDGLGVTKDPGKAFGTGVSVMATLHLFQNLHELAEILEWAGLGDSPSVHTYREKAARIRTDLIRQAVEPGADGVIRIVHGWGDKKSYLVGSSQDPDGVARDGLTSNAFWVLSGMHRLDPSLKQPILAAFHRLEAPAGYKTFHPAFEPGCPGVGRIPKLPAGTAENAASYIHASAFAVMALYQMGESREGWVQLSKILPQNRPFVSLSPFVMPNSYCVNEEKGIEGESMGDWRTGSANVVMKVLVRHLFGIQAGFASVVVAPASWQPFPDFRCAVTLRGRPFAVEYRATGRGNRTFTANGTPRTPVTDSVSGTLGISVSWEEIPAGGLTVLVED